MLIGSVLAHQGGWDELAFVAVPLAVFALLLWVAQRRARHDAEGDPEPPPDRR